MNAPLLIRISRFSLDTFHKEHFKKNCETLVQHHRAFTYAKQAQGVRKTEIKAIIANILWPNLLSVYFESKQKWKHENHVFHNLSHFAYFLIVLVTIVFQKIWWAKFSLFQSLIFWKKNFNMVCGMQITTTFFIFIILIFME